MVMGKRQAVLLIAVLMMLVQEIFPQVPFFKVLVGLFCGLT
jgi:hypothetical protein